MNRVGCLLLFLVAGTSSGGVAQVGPGKPRAPSIHPGYLVVTPDSVTWEAPPEGMFRGPPPTDTTSRWHYARLEGDPLKPGAPYTIAFGCSDGARAGPHWHPNDENIVVVKGAFALGTGDVFDSTALRDLTTGTYAFVPKRLHHFGVCKGETLLVEYGIGPLTINLLPAPKRPREKPPGSSHRRSST
jgi:hypothetical protein